MANVVFNGVQKIYPNGFHAVKNFNLEIHDREFMIFVGPSGCAKSTTMRMVAGLEEISGGTITIGNRIVNTLPPRERNIAMVFQDYALYPHMTVAENMSLGLRLQKVPKNEIEKKVAKAADILGLTTMLDRLPRQLSGGQRQRVALGRCIVRTPDVFMFDEPLSNLDPKLRTTMRVEIKKLHQSLNATMIYVTHDQIEAMTLGDRIVVMNAGEIQQVDTPMNLYNNPDNRFVAGFIGSPPINFFECELVQDGGDLRLKNDYLEVSLAGLEALSRRLVAGFDGAPNVSLGVRAEHMSIVDGSPADGDSFSAIVEVLEPVGAEVFVHMQTAGSNQVPFVVRQEYQQAAKYSPGDRVRIAIDRNRMHLFDPATEKVLR